MWQADYYKQRNWSRPHFDYLYEASMLNVRFAIDVARNKYRVVVIVMYLQCVIPKMNVEGYKKTMEVGAKIHKPTV